MKQIPMSYSLDDVLLRPQYSDIESRLKTNLKTNLTRNWQIDIPIASTNMSTITEKNMVLLMAKYGGVGFVHRFMHMDRQGEISKNLFYKKIHPIVSSIGVGEIELERAFELKENGTDILLIDVANAYSKQVFEQIEKVKSHIKNIDVIVGNVATFHGVKDLIYNGADAVRVGIGGGSHCATRSVTGHGVANLTTLQEAVRFRDQYMEQRNIYIPIIMDGGIKSSGDIVKSLYFGADLVSIGSLLAGTKETPGEIIKTKSGRMKKYYGMSSKDAQDIHKGGMKKGIASEGYSSLIPYKGSASVILEQLIGGIRSGLTYSGARNIMQLRELGEPMYLSYASQVESKLR